MRAAPALAQGVHPHTRLMGFADFNYLVTDREGAAEGFREGQLVGHLASELGERVGVFAEVSASASASGFRLGVERILLRYDVRDALKLSAGRFHTPIVYWNTAYHHGHWLQTTVGRPEMIRGGGTFLPIHFVGVQAEGTLPSWGIGYQVGFGNGRGESFTSAGDRGEQDFQPAYTAAVHYRPMWLPGVQVGASAYFDRPRAEGGEEVRERAGTAHLVVERRQAELVAEWGRVGHMVADSGSWLWGSGGYVQGGYRLPGAVRAFKPYARWESVDVPAGDGIRPKGSSYQAWLAGVRFDFTSVAALKAEYRRERTEAGRFRSFVLELSYT
ncbi:MAG: hypothetical protein ACREIV_09995, partial [Planctomycetaceae bacterium]